MKRKQFGAKSDEKNNNWHKVDQKRRDGGSMPTAAPMVRFLKCSRTGARRRGGRDLTAAAPEENLEFEGYFTQSAAVVEIWPPRRDVQTRF